MAKKFKDMLENEFVHSTKKLSSLLQDFPGGSAVKNLPIVQETRETWVRSLSQEVPKKVNAKECSNYHTIALISDTNKIMLKILQARLQQYMNCELPGVQAGFRQGRGTRDQIANSHWVIKKAREFQEKKPAFALLTMPKLLTVQISTNCGKF